MCFTFLPPHLMTRTRCMVRLCIVQYKQASIHTFCKLSAQTPHVKVGGDPQILAVSGKVVPLVDINSILLVGHDLRDILLIHALQHGYIQLKHTSYRNLFSILLSYPSTRIYIHI